MTTQCGQAPAPVPFRPGEVSPEAGAKLIMGQALHMLALLYASSNAFRGSVLTEFSTVIHNFEQERHKEPSVICGPMSANERVDLAEQLLRVFIFGPE